MAKAAVLTVAFVLLAVGVALAIEMGDAAAERNKRVVESVLVKAYMCGYRAGQNAIMDRLPSLFDPAETERESATCPAVQDMPGVPR